MYSVTWDRLPTTIASAGDGPGPIGTIAKRSLSGPNISFALRSVVQHLRSARAHSADVNSDADFTFTVKAEAHFAEQISGDHAVFKMNRFVVHHSYKEASG